MTVKSNHFEAAAQYRMSQDDLERNKYGSEIGRLRVAEGLAKKGLDAGKRGVPESVVADLKVNCADSRTELTGRTSLQPSSLPLSVLSATTTSSMSTPSRHHRSWPRSQASAWSSS
jgi:hypothetical protein